MAMSEMGQTRPSQAGQSLSALPSILDVDLLGNCRISSLGARLSAASVILPAAWCGVIFGFSHVRSGSRVIKPSDRTSTAALDQVFALGK
jgi:hypothetical protein